MVRSGGSVLFCVVGYITPAAGGADVFVGNDTVVAAGLTALPPGTRVKYDLIVEHYRDVAGNLSVG